MDIEKLQEHLPDEMFAEVAKAFSDLVGQRDQARNESIAGRKSLKENNAKLEYEVQQFREALGVDTPDELQEKGIAVDQAQQYEAKLKKYARDLEQVQEQLSSAVQERRNTEAKLMLSSALSSHDWVDRDVVETYVQSSVSWEGDDLYFKSPDGNLMTVADGVATLAKSKPQLLNPTGAGGAGVRSSNARGVAEGEPMTRAEFDALPAIRKAEVASEAGFTLID